MSAYGIEGGNPVSDATPEVLRPVDRRKPRAVLLLLGGLALGAGLMLGLLALIGVVGNSPSGAAMPGSMGPSPMPTSPGPMGSPSTSPGPMGTASPMTTEGGAAVLDALKMHIPVAIGDSCDPMDRQHVASFAYASLVCHPGGPVIEAQYSSFHDGVATRLKFSDDLPTAHVDPKAGACSATVPNGTSQWWAEPAMEVDGPVEHMVGGHRPAGATFGRMMCYWRGDRAWIEWFDSDTHIYAWASSSQDAYPQLLQWWTTQAGPFHPRMTGMRGTP
jgi:hypothetical protein